MFTIRKIANNKLEISAKDSKGYFIQIINDKECVKNLKTRLVIRYTE